MGQAGALLQLGERQCWKEDPEEDDACQQAVPTLPTGDTPTHEQL